MSATIFACGNCLSRGRLTRRVLHARIVGYDLFFRALGDSKRSDSSRDRDEFWGNVLGQGNRANSTIGRALQLVIRNIGGGKPQEVDRSAFGTPGKIGFCFAEDEAGSCWQSLAGARN